MCLVAAFQPVGEIYSNDGGGGEGEYHIRLDISLLRYPKVYTDTLGKFLEKVTHGERTDFWFSSHFCGLLGLVKDKVQQGFYLN